MAARSQGMISAPWINRTATSGEAPTGEALMNDERFMARIDGLYVGMLDEDEIDTFYDLCRRGLMQRDYSHPGGFMGLAKASITNAGHKITAKHLNTVSALNMERGYG